MRRCEQTRSLTQASWRSQSDKNGSSSPTAFSIHLPQCRSPTPFKVSDTYICTCRVIRVQAATPCSRQRCRCMHRRHVALQLLAQPLSDTSELTRWFRVPGGILWLVYTSRRVSFRANGSTKGLSPCCIRSACGSKAIRDRVFRRSTDS